MCECGTRSSSTWDQARPQTWSQCCPSSKMMQTTDNKLFLSNNFAKKTENHRYFQYALQLRDKLLTLLNRRSILPNNESKPGWRNKNITLLIKMLSNLICNVKKKSRLCKYWSNSLPSEIFFDMEELFFHSIQTKKKVLIAIGEVFG